MFTFEKIENYMEIPYKQNGRDFDGCDCYGLLLLIYANERGIKLADYNYSHSDKSSVTNTLIENMYKEFDPVIDPIPFDCLVMFKDDPKIPAHCGLVINSKQFIHCYEKNGVLVSKLALWRPTILGFYRYKGLK